jgi:uncharacterized protein with PhoU and TrkA domain
LGDSKDYNDLIKKGIKIDELVHKAIKDREEDVKTPKLKDKYTANEDSGLLLKNFDLDLRIH